MRSILAVTLFALGVACANGTPEKSEAKPVDETSATVPDDLGSLNGFCDAVAQAACSAAVVKACAVSSPDVCRRKRAAACLREVPQGTDYVSATAASCVSAVRSANADATLTVDELAASAKACGPAVFSGPGAARTSCSSPYDCRSLDGLTCLVPIDADQGKCMRTNTVAMGRPCGGEADVCSADAYCEATSHTCKARAALGQPCHPTLQPCAPGLLCPGAGPFGQGCVALKGTGVPCAADADCASGLCDKAKNQSAGNCADQIVLSPLDSACQPFIDDPDASN